MSVAARFLSRYNHNLVCLSRESLELLATGLSVKPVVVGLSALPDSVVHRDGEDDKENLGLETTESVENGSMEGTGKGLLSVTRDGVTSNTLLSGRAWNHNVSEKKVHLKLKTARATKADKTNV